MTHAFVRLSAVSKIFPGRSGPVQALDSISLDVNEQEFVSILGPSGCGKSTLLTLISGLAKASSGAIEVRGKAIDGPFTDVGIVFQRDVLLDWRTIMGNVVIQYELRGLDVAEGRRRAAQLLCEVGLGGFENSYPHELSGGMRQRAAICRAFVHDPPLLIMDEPFAALDALTRDQMTIDLQHLWQSRKKTVLFITHSVAEAVFLSDTVFVMSARPGRIAKTLKIDLPRPRTLATRESAPFGAYSHEILEVIKSQGVLNERTEPPVVAGAAT